jgi:glyoxylase-like metal-dependent hydrolase (beta-lactamase superfamily II)
MPEIYAIRHGAAVTTRSAIYRDFAASGREDAEVAMDFFFWVIADPDRITLVDTGFDPVVAAKHGRRQLMDPVEGLALLDITPDEVDHVIVTHFHYDHVGNLARFPKATLSVQRSELDFWAGPGPARSGQDHLAEATEIAVMTEAITSGRALVLEESGPLRPGIELKVLGGHTAGQQIVIVAVGDQRVVLASDAIHFYEELDLDTTYAIVDNPAAMRQAYAELRQLRDAGAVLVAGHDPLVRELFSPVPGLPAEFVTRIV